MNEFPLISHVLQCDNELFPWDLAAKQISNLPERDAMPLTQQEVEDMTMNGKFQLGDVTDIPALMANMLISSSKSILIVSLL